MFFWQNAIDPKVGFIYHLEYEKSLKKSKVKSMFTIGEKKSLQNF